MSQKLGRLKMPFPDGKMRKTDAAHTETFSASSSPSLPQSSTFQTMAGQSRLRTYSRIDRLCKRWVPAILEPARASEQKGIDERPRSAE